MSTPSVKPPVILDVKQDEKGQLWYTVSCPHCGEDLSERSVGRLFNTGQHIQTDILHPLQCSKCRKYLLPALQGPKVWRPGMMGT